MNIQKVLLTDFPLFSIKEYLEKLHKKHKLLSNFFKYGGRDLNPLTLKFDHKKIEIIVVLKMKPVQIFLVKLSMLIISKPTESLLQKIQSPPKKSTSCFEYYERIRIVAIGRDLT